MTIDRIAIKISTCCPSIHESYNIIYNTHIHTHLIHRTLPAAENPIPKPKRQSLLDSLSIEYWRICSWQKGQPKDLVRTTSDTPASKIRSDIGTGNPSRRYTVDCESAFLASSTRFLALDDGPPDSIVVVTAAESAEGDDDYDATAVAAGSVGRGT